MSRKQSLVRDLVGHRDPIGSGMGREGVPRARAKRRESHRSRKLEKSWVRGGGEGPLPEAGRVGGKGGSHSAVALFFPLQSLSRQQRPRRKSPQRWRSQPISTGLRNVTGRSLYLGAWGGRGRRDPVPGSLGGGEEWYLVAGVGGGRKGQCFLGTFLQSEKLTFRCSPPRRAGEAALGR